MRKPRDKSTLTKFEYIFNFIIYSATAYMAPIKLARNICKCDILLFDIIPVAYKII